MTVNNLFVLFDVGRKMAFMKETVVSSSKDVMGGTPVFTGTRVPIETLIDYLTGGDTIDDFLEGFPTVGREQVVEFLRQAEAQMEKIAA